MASTLSENLVTCKLTDTTLTKTVTSEGQKLPKVVGKYQPYRHHHIYPLIFVIGLL